MSVISATFTDDCKISSMDISGNISSVSSYGGITYLGFLNVALDNSSTKEKIILNNKHYLEWLNIPCDPKLNCSDDCVAITISIKLKSNNWQIIVNNLNSTYCTHC